MDPSQSALEEVVRQKRVEEIYGIKMAIEQLEEEIARGIATNRIKGDPRTAYLLMVQSYVRAIEPLLNPDEGTTSPYWTSALLAQYELPDGSVRRVTGLGEFLSVEMEQTASWTEEVSRKRNWMTEEVTRTETVRPPRRLAEKAFLAANAGLRAKGLDIDGEDTTIGAEEAADDGGIGA